MYMTMLKRQLKIANFLIVLLANVVKVISSEVVASHLPHQPL